MLLPVTALYAGILALLHVFLGVRIPPMRMRKRVGIGDGDDREIAKAIRVHGNFIENTPIFLVLIGILELNGLNVPALHALGIAFVIGRVSHAIALSRSTVGTTLRIFGMSTTWLTIAAAGLLTLYQFTIGI